MPPTYHIKFWPAFVIRTRPLLTLMRLLASTSLPTVILADIKIWAGFLQNLSNDPSQQVQQILLRHTQKLRAVFLQKTISRWLFYICFWIGATNYWHYVNIAKKSGNGGKDYTWTNAAGVAWTLTFSESFEEGGKLTFMWGWLIYSNCPLWVGI